MRLLNAYNSRSLEGRSATIKYEDRLDAVKDELAYPAKESKNVCIVQTAAFFVTHCGLKLVDPYA